MKTFSKSSLIYGIAGTLLLISAIMLTWDIFSGRTKNIEDAMLNARSELNLKTGILDEKLAKISDKAEILAEDISTGLDHNNIIARLKQDVEFSEDIFGFGVGFEKFKAGPDKELYAPFYIKPDGKTTLTFVDTSYDYTNSEWYSKPLKNGAAWFEPPYFGEVAQTMIAEYSVPFDLDGNNEADGIVYIDLSLNGLTKIINGLSIGKSGYGFLLSENGIFIVHPVSEWVKSEKNITDFAKDYGDNNITKLFESNKIEGKDYLDIIDPLSNQESRLMFSEIPSTGWKLGIMFISAEFIDNYKSLKRKFSISIFLFVLSAVFYVLSFRSFKAESLKTSWVSAILITMFFAAGIGLIWFQNTGQKEYTGKDDNSYMIHDQSVLNKFIQSQDSIAALNNKNIAVKIPTGVFIEHIEISGKNTINLSGTIWQEIDNQYVNEIEPGVVFPEISPDAEAVSIEEAFRKKKSRSTFIRWYFRVALRHKIEYSSYPFDRQTISLRLWTKDWTSNILLVPDLKSYSVINPSLLPGIEKDIVLRSMIPVSSFFDFEEIEYNTSFGIGDNFSGESKSELHFNIVLERNFLGPFITNIIPLIVISVLLFTIVMSTSSREKDTKLGFTGFGVLEICAAFYFVVILAHIDFRNTLGVQQIIYLDFFYFLIYLKILVYAINSILLTKYENIKFVQYKNNLYPRLLYWPVYLGLLFVVTYFVFY